MNLIGKFGFLLLLVVNSTQVLSRDIFNKTEVNGYEFDSRVRTPLQDDTGFIWYSSKNSVWRFDGYSAVNINKLFQTKNHDLSQTRFFYQDQSGDFWAGTHNGHLVKITESVKEIVIEADTENDTAVSYAAISESADGIWVASKNELLSIKDEKILKYPFPNDFSNSLVNSLVADGQFIYVVTSTHLLRFSTASNLFEVVLFSEQENPPNLRSAVLKDRTLWLATDQGVYIKKTDSEQWESFLPEVLNMKIRSVNTDQNYIWVATVLNGLFRIDKVNRQIKHYTNDPNDLKSLASNELTDVMIDESGLVWIFHFSGMIEYLNLNQSTMGLDRELAGTACNQNQVVYAFFDDLSNYWYLTQKGIVKLNKVSGQCSLINSSIDQMGDVFINRIPFSVTQDENKNKWIGTSDGVLKLNSQDELSIHFADIQNINRIKYLGNDELILVTDDGIFVGNTQNGKSTHLTDEETFRNVKFNDVLISPSNTLYFASSEGVFHTDQLTRTKIKKLPLSLNDNWVNSLMFDHKSNLWLGTQSSGVIVFDSHLAILKQIMPADRGRAQTAIFALLEDENKHVWASTNNGLYQIEESFKVIHNYTVSNGLQGLNFTIGAAYRSQSGKFFFGGRNGYNSFYPNQVKLNNTPPSIALTRFSRFNNTVIPNDESAEFLIKSDINELSNLTLSHADYVIGIEFTALSFAHADENKYAYKLSGFDQDWNHVNADNRTATYTNLPSGTYQFQVKGSNHDGTWSREPKSLKITVLPPPWLTWWAITSYVLIILFCIFWYVQRKVKANKKVAAMLRIEVAEKTNELNLQKTTVESLLAKKNELFSNVSHEFRTPLTLILGPIKELINKQVNTEDIKSLGMIKRNANRLLSLVEQLLQIARVSDFKKVNTTPQNAQIQIKSLVESFQHMAESKNVDLQLIHNDHATLNVTDQFIDATLGNLVSNAIKYTQSGGTVTIASHAKNDSLLISVEDTGAGLTQEQQRDVFKRFRRLESHQSIEGIGIGLSVVEEVVKINDGSIQVVSEVGVGSKFTLSIPLSEVTVSDETKSISTLVNQLRTESPATVTTSGTEHTYTEDSNLNTVLVIEDNHDMREHIIDIVSTSYNCISAENGVKGVAAAIEQIPDIIISDVMMPEMDGFKVARVIRADEKTSHIPLVLLTALNDKTNRIKGWRENVDAYMTKPFDRDELLVQLENMLTIRDILKTKAGQLVKEGQSITAALPKKDKEFIEKLVEIIQLNYPDPILNRMKIASKMAVSERQLQRKTKALIDQNPMDMLREFRLKKSKELLKEGNQVSIVADDCGFNSVSYFSQCFKAQNGISPKQYQQTE